ncbi:hypothetical protein GLYMA_15G179101v4 [Glycine max]|nr:hypothetical protein GLYMA_15G179101v4 [Glycine max]KAH1147720.1 hypothetical protein GYH30_042725 [Glycine max]
MFALPLTRRKREPQRPLTLSLFPFQIPFSLVVVFGAAQPKPDLQIPLSLSDLNAYCPSHGVKVHPQGAQGLVERPTNFLQSCSFRLLVFPQSKQKLSHFASSCEQVPPNPKLKT